MKTITWHLEGCRYKSITKVGAGQQPVFATLSPRERAYITIFCTRVTEENRA